MRKRISSNYIEEELLGYFSYVLQYNIIVVIIIFQYYLFLDFHKKFFNRLYSCIT